MKKILTLVIALFVVIGAVVALKKKMVANAATPTLTSYDLNVKAFTPKESNVTLTSSILALVKNDHDASLSAKFPAALLFILPTGSHVSAGDVVARLDNRDFVAKKESLQTALFAAQDEEKAKAIALEYEKDSHKRTLQLLSVQGASLEQSQTEESKIALLKADIHGVKAKQSQIKSDIKTLNAQLDYATLRAPVSGIVSELFGAVGDVATPGKPLATIRASSGAYLLVRVALGTPAKTLLYGTYRAPLHFLQNSNGVDEYRADIDANLPSDARIEAKMVTFEGQATLLPRDAVLLKDEKAFIFVIQGNHAKAQEITIVAQGDEGFVTSNILNGSLALGKADILLKLLSGASLHVKE